MACCTLLLTLLARFMPGQPSAPRVPVVPLVALAGVELAVALAFSSDSKHHVHAVPSPGGLEVAVAAVWTIAMIQVARRANRRPGLAVAGGVAIALAGLVAWALPALDPMLALMSCVAAFLMACPLLLVGTTIREGVTDDVWVVARLTVAAALAAAVIVLVLSTHLPPVRDAVLGEDWSPWWLPPALLALGLAFWSATLRFSLPQGWRIGLVVAVMETGSVLGLVMLAAGQWAAGGVMILADVATAAALAPTLLPSRRPVRGPRTMVAA